MPESSNDIMAQMARKKADDLASGKRCSQCEAYIHSIRPRPSCPQKCMDCERMATSLRFSVTHEKLIRCPKCAGSFDPIDNGDNDEVLSEGEHGILCRYCDHDFMVSTRVSFTFKSPACEELVVGNGLQSVRSVTTNA